MCHIEFFVIPRGCRSADVQIVENLFKKLQKKLFVCTIEKKCLYEVFKEQAIFCLILNRRNINRDFKKPLSMKFYI